MSNHQYFGTDGIRGIVGKIPITPDFILKLGWAAGKVLSRNKSLKIIIGRDTRISGYMLESALEAGLSAAGISAVLTGPIPTPAIAYLTRILRVEAGIVISGSHNLFYDNGIKFFSINGTKLSIKTEQAIETELDKPLMCVKSASLGKSSSIIDAADRYIEFCKDTFPSNLSLKGLKIIVDCANGATHHIAPSVLCDLGANVIALSCCPDGININKECGATDVRYLQSQVLSQGADLGIAYDGDGDRVVMVDHLGHKVDGDQIIYIIARERLRKGNFFGGVVGTLMSNVGLEIGLNKLKLPFVRASIGDRCVLEKMQEKGWILGAENSGHIILLDKTTTGDGIIASLQVLSVIIENDMNLYDLCSGMSLLPQVIINLNYTGKYNPLEIDAVKQAICDVENQLSSGYGRVLLRKSGTESIIRVMVEGEDIEHVSQLARQIADIVKAFQSN